MGARSIRRMTPGNLPGPGRSLYPLLAIEFRVMSPVRFRRVWDQLIWSLRLMTVPVVAISNGLRGRWSVWTPTSQVRTDLRQTGA